MLRQKSGPAPAGPAGPPTTALVECTHLNRLVEVFLMSTNYIHVLDKLGIIFKLSLSIHFLSCRKNFTGTQKWVRMSHDKRDIGVRVIEGYIILDTNDAKFLHADNEDSDKAA